MDPKQKSVDTLLTTLAKLSESINRAETAEELKELCSAVCSVVVTLLSI